MPVARTVMSAVFAEMFDKAPIPACVSASALTSASGVASEPAPRPKDSSAEFARAALLPVASIVISVARVTSPSSAAEVPPRA